MFQKKVDAPIRGQLELIVNSNDDSTVKDIVTLLTKVCIETAAGQFNTSKRERAPKKPTKITTLHGVESNYKSPRSIHSNSNDQKKIIFVPSMQGKPVPFTH